MAKNRLILVSASESQQGKPDAARQAVSGADLPGSVKQVMPGA